MKISSATRYLANSSDAIFGTTLSRPRYISFIITKNCNLACCHCDIWKNKDLDEEIQEEKWHRVLADIKNWLPDQEVELNGGEPLLKKQQVLKLIEKCNELNLPVSLNTNATLIDKFCAGQLLKNELVSIKVSLYSLNPAVHDGMRGVPGALEKAKQGLYYLNEFRLKRKTRIEIAMLITKRNISDIDSVINYAVKNDFELILQPLDANVDSEYNGHWQEKSDLWPQKEQVMKYLMPLLQYKPGVIKNPTFYLKLILRYYLDPNSLVSRRCSAPYNNLVIWPNGDTALCYRGNLIGNILKNRIRPIWQGARAILERERLKTCQKSCKIIGCNMKKQIKDFTL